MGGRMVEDYALLCAMMSTAEILTVMINTGPKYKSIIFHSQYLFASLYMTRVIYYTCQDP